MKDKDLQSLRKQDINLREAIARREQHCPQMPIGLNDRLMERVSRKPQNKHRYLPWIAVTAACFVGTFVIIRSLQNNGNSAVPDELSLMAQIEQPMKESVKKEPDEQTDSVEDQEHILAKNTMPAEKKEVKPLSKKENSSNSESKETQEITPSTISHEEVRENETHLENALGQHVVYASQETQEDTTYQPPRLMDEFIAKLAAYHQIDPIEMECFAPVDSNTERSLYIFPDNEQVDLFGRLLQVACWYDNKTPGYQFYFSHLQFIFELDDEKEGLKYLWTAERTDNGILLYSMHSPVGTPASTACYQEFKQRYVTKSIRSIYHQL